MREYAWKYFDRHAEQRLKAFNFYILICAANLAGVASVLREPNAEWLGIPFAAVLCIVSVVFWKLDNRTRDLIIHSEQSLKCLENEIELPDDEEDGPHRYKLFSRERYERDKAPMDKWSYTTCFRFIILMFQGIGILLIFSLIKVS